MSKQISKAAAQPPGCLPGQFGETTCKISWQMVCSSAKSDIAHGISKELGLLCSGSRSAKSTDARAAADGITVASNASPAREIGGSAWLAQQSWQ